ncbi:hypothetical protein [uncultured Draconibacterium sp.]|uniref:MutS-related protein n=1 Tax=uncultured Draconibacterium sp. TaxID=1573823 RepID=UPI0025E1B45C|nr:hypothetical protein [uncultured Draconibacterium sp.]
MGSPSKIYKQKLLVYTSQLLQVTTKVKRMAWLRFVTFVAIFIPIFVAGWSIISLCLMLPLIVLFFYLIKKNVQLEKRKQKLIVKKKLLEDELKALDHSFLHFYCGEEFLSINHPYSYDLDLFGKGSLFQFLNRTTTVGGKKKLADCLLNPIKNPSKIRERQQAVQELAAHPLWRLEFLTEGNLFHESEEQFKEIHAWAEMELLLKNEKPIKWLLWLLPAITLLAAIFALIGGSGFFLGGMLVAQFGLLFSWTKKINQYFSFFGRKSELLAKYMQLLEQVEEAEFTSSYLLRLQNKISEPSAGKLFNQLASLVKVFEFRQNILVGIALNGILTWDIRCVYQLWKWHQANSKQLAVWLDVLAEIDSLVSLANYANNHPEFEYPELIEAGFVFNAQGLGHPLLKPDKRVCNDLEMRGWSQIMIVTGANMAGKSTFLRTVGVNILLAEIGAPVCATRMQISPLDLYTNMRTTDSLLKDESYFFAELKRIKNVLDRLATGEQIFVILDEMLKGTNSVDKLNGSKELLRKLAQHKCAALVATHDLKLSQMQDELPGKVFNRCFEIKIENNELIFDYKLSEGVTQTMNATFLMKKMGII